MKRREVLKGISVVAGHALCGHGAFGALPSGQAAAPAEPLAVAIRALMQTGAGERQPIQISMLQTQAGAPVVTLLDGVELDRRKLPAGPHTFQVGVPPVGASRQGMVTVQAGEAVSRATVTLQPVRKVLVYVLPHSHHDLGYTDLQAAVEEKQMNNITLGMELARETASYPEGARFVWNLEVLWGADLFLRRKSPAEVQELLAAIKRGWISPNGMYANELTGLCRPEELLRLFRFGTELGKRAGVPIDAAMLSDVPGFTWGTVTAMAQAGIRYFSAAPNFFDRIGDLMVEWQDRPVWARSPSGKEKVLLWIPWTGYAMSHVMKLSPEWVGRYQDRLDTVDFRYDISYIRWSGHGDNATPDPELCEFIKGWKEQYTWPQFAIASTSEAFSAFEKRHGAELPEVHGDLTPYWEDGAGSSARETRMNRVAADRLTQAETIGAMFRPDAGDVAALDEAWRDVLLYSEHTWGADRSVSDPESDFTKEQWKFKQAFAMQAKQRSTALLAAAMPAAGTNPAAIDVHNSTSWPRSEVVILPAGMSTPGDEVHAERGAAVPSQRLSTGELAFWAEGIPAFGSARFHLRRGKAKTPRTPSRYSNGVLENGLLRAKIDPASGNLVELTKKGSTRNLIDCSNGEAANQYLFLAGSDVTQLKKSGDATIHVEDNGPLVTTVSVSSAAPGCKSLVRRVRLAAGADYLELINRVDKERAAVNPKPGQGGAGGAFAQGGGKESVQFAFPLAVTDGVMRLDVPMAVMRPELDQLPGACKNWLPVSRWVDVSNREEGVTWVTLDAPLIEVGEVSANLLGSNRDPKVWRKTIAPTQRFYSWVMNNHWGTNYRAYQEGVVEFRYVLRPHGGFDAAAAGRLGTGLSQPLVTSVASASPVRSSSLLRIEPAEVQALMLKSSDDGKGLVLRLFGASGESRRAKLTWTGEKVAQVWRSNTAEERLERLEGEIPVDGWEVVTLRVDPA